MIEPLYTILLVVAIVVGLLLIANLVRLYLSLRDFNEITAVTRKRTKEVDSYLGRFLAAIEHAPEAIKTFFTSLDFAKGIKKKIDKYLDGEKHKDE